MCEISREEPLTALSHLNYEFCILWDSDVVVDNLHDDLVEEDFLGVMEYMIVYQQIDLLWYGRI